MNGRMIHILGLGGVGLILAGAALYAVNAGESVFAGILLAAGLAMTLAYALANYRRIFDFMGKRSSRHGANTIVVIVVFAAILIIIQAIAVRHSYRHDFTRNKRFSLAGQTLTVLDSLSEDVTAYAFYKKDSADRFRAKSVFDQFSHRNPRFRYEIIDPDQKPQRAREMNIVTYGTTVVEAAGKREHIKSMSEEDLLNAIIRATSGGVKVVYFVRGHGEKDPSNERPNGYSIAAEEIEKQNYDVRTLSLFDEESIPDDCVVLVSAGPRTDYLDSEIDKLRTWLNSGGNALFLIEPRTDLPNIEALLSNYRVTVNNDAIVDPYSRVFGGDYSVPVVTEYGDHPIVRDFDVATFFPTARSVSISQEDKEAVAIAYLAMTGKSAWGETDLELIENGQAVRSEDDNPAPVHIGLISEKRFKDGIPDVLGPDQSAVVVFGDSDFGDNSSFRLSANSDLFLNIINYLAQEKDRIAIRAKEALGDRLFLTASQGRFIFLASVVLLPLAVIAFGVAVFVRRRQAG
jgi:ABC-type uncharacterized transport system involved in gliding motility auxiliary subunit